MGDVNAEGGGDASEDAKTKEPRKNAITPKKGLVAMP